VNQTLHLKEILIFIFFNQQQVDSVEVLKRMRVVDWKHLIWFILWSLYCALGRIKIEKIAIIKSKKKVDILVRIIILN